MTRNPAFDPTRVHVDPPVDVPTPVICPECQGEKHRNCDGIGWDPSLDGPVPCECLDAEHLPAESS